MTHGKKSGSAAQDKGGVQGVQPIAPSTGRKRAVKSRACADQEYIQRLADVDCAEGEARP